MKSNNRQTAALGAFLIVLGLVWWLHLGWLVAPGALAIAGVLAYRQRRALGRPVEAVQSGLWCFGLAILFLTHFWFGVLFLAGLSLLLRGRELEVDTAIQQALSQARSRRAAPRSINSQPVPITTQSPTSGYDTPSTSSTTRLSE